MDGRDELLGNPQAVDGRRPLQPVLDRIARRMLLISALFTPFFLAMRLAPLLGGNLGVVAVVQMLVAGAAIVVLVLCTIFRARLNAKQIGWVIAIVAASIGLGGIYRLGTNTALTTFIFLSLMSLALFVGRRATLITGLSLWLFAIVMTVVRNQDQLQDLDKLLDVETGVVGVGSGFGSGILVVILIADVLPNLLSAVDRALSQRTAERQRRWSAEARSEQVETRWKRYFDLSPVGMTIVDASGKVVAWSARTEQYLGISREQVMGEPLVDFLRRLDESHPFITQVQQVLGGQVLKASLLQLATEMGIRTVLIEGDPLYDDSGAVSGAFLVGVDVTPLIGQDDSEPGGQRLVLGQQKALASMAGKLVGIRSALLSAGLSGESIATELANETPLVERLRGSIAVLTEQQRGAARLADEAFREISDSRDRDVVQQAGPITEAALALFHSRVEKEGIELDLDDAFAEGATISAPPVLVRQILINLISNAREAIARSSKAVERRILIRVAAVADTVDFVVEDTAGSVLPVNRDVYFNPTYSTKGGRDGSGRGLYVSRHTAERLGGELNVEQGEQGLRFVLSLPRHVGGDDS